MGWMSFDEWQKRQGLSYAVPPVATEESGDPAAAAADPDGRKGGRPPGAEPKQKKRPQTECRKRHLHPKGQPATLGLGCRCTCSWCTTEQVTA